jgi:hypothetical protein
MSANIHDVEKYIAIGTPGLEYSFKNPWIMWKQYKSNYDQYNFFPFFKFSTIAGFWALINNIDFFNEEERLIFMRDGIIPEWEDSQHKFGAYFMITINIKKQNMRNIFVECLFGLVQGNFCKNDCDNTNITGVTFVYEKNYKQMRIWLSNRNIPLCYQNISPKFLNIFYDNRIVPRHFFLVEFDKLKEKNELVKIDQYHWYFNAKTKTNINNYN